VMWMRMTEGIDEERFRQTTGHDIDTLCGESIRSMQEEGLLKRGGNTLALTPEALFVCNAVFSELV